MISKRNILTPLMAFLAAAVVLGVQIVLSRLFAIILLADITPFIISLAVLGMGAGALVTMPWTGTFAAGSVAAAWGIAASTGLCVVVTAFVDPAGSWTFMYFVAPFAVCFASGALMALLYRDSGLSARWIFASDLLGAACGTILSVLVFNLSDPVGIPLLLLAGACLIPLAAAADSSRPAASIAALLSGTVALGLFVGNHHNGWLRLTQQRLARGETTMGHTLRGIGKPRIVDTVWSSFSRCDMVAFEESDLMREIYINSGTQATVLNFRNSDLRGLDWVRQTPYYMPFQMKNFKTACVIGSGGGSEVLVCLNGGVEKVTAVEINPDVVELVKRHPDFAGNVYDRPDVSVVVEDGRTFMRSSKSRYDMVLLPLTIGLSMGDVSGFSLFENYVFTKEALRDLSAKLAPPQKPDEIGGFLVVVLNYEVLFKKFLVTAAEAFSKTGAEAPLGPDFTDSFIAMKSLNPSSYRFMAIYSPWGFSDKAVDSMAVKAKSRNCEMIHLPGYTIENEYAPLFQGHVKVSAFSEPGAEGFTPCTDDKPFFFDVNPSSKVRARFYKSAILSLGLLALASLLALGWLIGRVKAGHTVDGGEPWAAIALVFSGLGYMSLEMLLLKKLPLFTGVPHLTLPVILGGFVLGTGFAAFPARFLFDCTGPRRKAILPWCVVLCLLVALFGVRSDLLISSLSGFGPMTRVSVAAGICVIFGFMAGVIFPVVLETARKRFAASIPMIMAINTVASVAGCFGAVLVAMESGISSAALVTSGFYLAVCYPLARLGKRVLTTTVVSTQSHARRR